MAGVYTAGYTLASSLSLVIEGIGHSWLTLFLKAEKDPAKQSAIVTSATYFVSVAALFALAGALFLPLFVRVALPPVYAESERIAVFVVLGLMLTAPYTRMGLRGNDRQTNHGISAGDDRCGDRKCRTESVVGSADWHPGGCAQHYRWLRATGWLHRSDCRSNQPD